jgi:hypothetical protein
MDQPGIPSSAARRNEDIALDLFKFIATTTNVGRPAVGSTGFTAPHSAKADDQVAHLLELYTRCLQVVEGKNSR